MVTKFKALRLSRLKYCMLLVGIMSMALQSRPAHAVWVTPDENCGVPQLCDSEDCISIRSDVTRDPVTGQITLSGAPGPYTFNAVQIVSNGTRYECDAPIQNGDKCCERIVFCSSFQFFEDITACAGNEPICDGGCGGTPSESLPWANIGCFFGDPSRPECT